MINIINFNKININFLYNLRQYFYFINPGKPTQNETNYRKYCNNVNFNVMPK